MSRVIKKPAAPRQGVSDSQGADWLLYGGALAVAAVAVFRLRRLMHYPVQRETVAVVYDARRRVVWSTSADGDAAVTGESSPNHTASGLWPVALRSLLPSNARYVTRPPLPFFRVFSFPRCVLLPEVGSSMTCAVEDVRTGDGTVVALEVTLRYHVAFRELSRYLSLVGPVAPNATIGKLVAEVVQNQACRVNSGSILSQQKMNQQFAPLCAHLIQGRLLADCALTVRDVVIVFVRELPVGG